MTYRAIIEPAVLEDRIAWRWLVQHRETPRWEEGDTWRTIHAGILRREADARDEAEAMLTHVVKGTLVVKIATVAYAPGIES